MDLHLKDKVALVFGSSAGIGKAIAQSLIQEGATVTLCARTESTLKKTAEEISAPFWVNADLAKSSEAKRVVETVIERFGHIDILIINTGGPQKGKFLDVSIDQWEKDYQNLWLSTVEALQAALPTMKKRKWGRVLLVTSIAAKEPLPELTTSNGLRAGLTGLCKSIANEVAADGITLNLLLPGYTNTDRIKALNLSESKIKEMVPAGRLGRPEELADLATFLSSEKGSYITGQSIAIDGGVLKGF